MTLIPLTSALMACIKHSPIDGQGASALAELRSLLDTITQRDARIAELEAENEELFQDSPAAVAIRSVFGSPALNLESIPMFFGNNSQTEGEQNE